MLGELRVAAGAITVTLGTGNDDPGAPSPDECGAEGFQGRALADALGKRLPEIVEMNQQRIVW